MQKSIRLSKSGVLRISNDALADIAFIFFFSSSLFSPIFGKLLSIFGMETAFLRNTLIFLVAYCPLLIYISINRGKKIPFDFIVLFWSVSLFFLISLIIHPEYQYWYGRSDYGVLSYVFKPTEGLYAYLFVRLIKDPKRLHKDMKISGWLMYIYFAYSIYDATRRGYWMGVAQSGAVKMSYSVSFGYEVMLYVLPFFYDFLQHKKLGDLAGTAIGLFMILSNGSRGPALFIGLFVVAFAVVHMQKSRKKVLYIFLMVAVVILLYTFYIPLLMLLAELFDSLGISSRFITKMLNGSLLENNGRIEIWTAAWEMIKKNPFGYGAMGSQPVISKYIYAGYPHSVFLEIFIDFGVFLGSLILVFLLWNAYKMLFYRKNRAWLPVFLPYFATSWQLLISLCYWSSPPFWASIATGVNCYLDGKNKSRSNVSD